MTPQWVNAWTMDPDAAVGKPGVKQTQNFSKTSFEIELDSSLASGTPIDIGYQASIGGM
jgi:hypothetical protein